MLSVFGQFSLRFIKERKGRAAATVFGITLGIVVIVATAIVNRSTLASFKQMVTTSAGKAELQVLPSVRSGFDAKYVNVISGVRGVKGAYPVVTGNTRVVKDARDVDTLMIYGVDASIDRKVREYDLSKGRFIGGRGREIVLTSQWASDYGVKAENDVTLLTAAGLKSFRVVGLISDKGAGNTNGGKFAVTDIETAREMFTRAGRVDQVDVTLEDGFKEDAVKASLESELGKTFVVERPAGRGKDVEDSMAGYQFMLSLAGSISLLVGLFIIYNNMEISVEERRFSIAMMRALGLRRKKILLLVLGEAAILGSVGGFIGVILGAGLARSMAMAFAGISSALNRVNLTELGLTPGIFLTGLAAGPAAAMAAALGPAYRMVKVSPMEALVPVETSWGKRNRRTIALGVLLLIVGAAALIALTFPEKFRVVRLTEDQFKAFGVGGLGLLVGGSVLLMPGALRAFLKRVAPRRIVPRMALDNLGRVSGRTSAAIAGMMIALIMMVSNAAQSLSYGEYTRNWIDKSVGWDMLVSSSYFGAQMDVPLDEEFGRNLRAIEGVKIACTLRFTRASYGGSMVNLSAFDMDTFFRFAKFDLQDGEGGKIEERMKSGEYVAVSSGAARTFKLKAGNVMELSTPDGKARFKVAAVVKDLGSDNGNVYIDRPTYKRLWGDSRVDGYDVVLKDGYTVEEVKERIEREIGKGRHLTIRTHEDFKKGIMSLVDQSFALTDLVIYIAVFVATVGIMNGALISVWQRKREISTLRALGARRRQVSRILLTEAVAIGLTGSLFGTAIGMFLGKAMVESGRVLTGIILEYKAPWPVVVWAVALAVGLSSVVSVIPGRAAARSSIVDGIRYE